MTKEVLIRIEGRQIGSDEEPIITTAPGVYHYRNGKHYIQYNETLLDASAVSKNMIKIEPSKVVLTKKMVRVSDMVFDRAGTTRLDYQTPYGDLSFDLQTYSILLKEGQDRLEVYMEYSLYSNSAHVSDNSILITIASA
ncbi:MAG TPA: DUF1934 domain-containing protein [Clostridiales bacterium]|nr:DUF1934 domain-containing protein [Clostridiales bacterium]